MAIPTNGLDFYLPFDADKDEKIHSLTGTLSSSSAATYFMLSSDTTGNFLRCTKTQGNNSYYLKYPGSESLMQYGTGDFSVSFWLRSPNWSDFMNVVFEKKYDDSQDGFVVYADGSEPVLDMRLRANTGSTSMDHFTETYCNSSVFLHWCFVRVGTVGYWYCNGVLDSTTEGETTGSVSSDKQFKIGYSAAWTYKQAVFDLKALRIYNRALSDSEITELSKEFADEGTSGGTGVVIDGLFLSTSKPKAGDKGLLVNNKFFIPFAESSEGGSGGTSAEYYKCASVDTEAKTWSGYKAVFDSGTGTWSFESGVTAGLAYTNVTPVVGGIYSADALVIVSLLYTGTPTLTSPTGMTSESSDEWEISASGNYGAYYPWKAFDGITDPRTNCWTGNSGSSWWIQWQNKQKQVLVQRLKMTVADSLSQQAVLSFTLQGSDDGNTWTDIHSESGLSWTTNGESKEFTFANSKSYYYHRLADITAPSFPTILELETYDM